MKPAPPLVLAGPGRWLLAWAVLAPAAAPAAVDTIEAAVADSDAVVVASLSNFHHAPSSQPTPHGRATLDVREVIKGQAGGAVSVIVPSFHFESFATWNRWGGRRIVLLVRSDRAAWHPTDPRYPLALRTLDWTLSEAAYGGLWGSVTAPGKVQGHNPLTFTLDMRVLRTFDAARAAAREAATWPGPPTRGYAVLDIPPKHDMRQAWKISDPRLRVPLDERAERVAQGWASDPAYAHQVATVLAEFPSDQNVEILHRLLDDPRTTVFGPTGKAQGWRHPTRAIAAQALERWGRLGRPARVRGPQDLYTTLGTRHAVAAFALAVGAAVVMALGRVRGRRLPVVALLLACAFATFVWLLMGGRRTVHEMTWCDADSRYWVSSYRDGIQFVRIKDWPKRQPLSYGRFDLRSAPDTLWNEQDVLVSESRSLAGFRRLSGSMWGDLRGTTYPYASFTVPTAGVAGAAALWPAWSLVALACGRSRRRRRLARGCCTACGYNLRGAGDCCPECGEPRPAPPERRGLLALVALVAVTAMAPGSRARAAVDTIETAVTESDVVVVARLQEFVGEPAHGPKHSAHVTLRVVEVMKGQAPTELRLFVPTSQLLQFLVWRSETGERLVLFVRPERGAGNDDRYQLALRPGEWAVIGGGMPAFTMGFRMLRSPGEAITVGREAVKWPAPSKGYVLLDAPTDNEPGSAMRGWFGLRLRVPVDERMERVAHQWADDPTYATQVAMVLSHFPSDHNAAILTRLLDDPATVVEGVRHGKAMGWRHPAREAAGAALVRWGRLDRPVPARGPRDFYVSIKAAHLVAAGAVAFAAAGTALVLSRRGWRAPLVAALLMAGLGAVAWHLADADQFVHEATWSLGSSRYWVSAYRDSLQFVRIQNWPERLPLSVGRLDLADAPESLWTEQELLVSKATQFAGFRSVVGSAWGPQRGGVVYPYASFTAPAAAVVALLASWPAWLALSAARRRARRRARVARGCCGECGYELVGAGDRCPECGAPRPASPSVTVLQ